MPTNDDATTRRYAAALDALMAQVRADRAILAAILCGSLSHDTVWTRSDIDLVLVTIDDRKVERTDIALNADGVNVHAYLLPRAEFRKAVEASVRSSFMHSLLAKGRLLYTHDPTIADLVESLAGAIGDRDAQVQLLRAATTALFAIDKARKWLVTRADLNYSALWILYAATPLAQVEAISARQLVDREVILTASRLNPAFFKTIYADLLNAPKSVETVRAALDAIDAYVAERACVLFRPVLDYLGEVGEARSCGELEDHFARNFDVRGVTVACEYLAARGLAGKASTPARLTKKSNVDVQELAFFALAPSEAATRSDGRVCVGAAPRVGPPSSPIR
jgi:uncharacterized protein